MAMTNRHKILILASLVIFVMSLLPLATGCTPEGRELAIAFLKEWAAEKNIDPSTPEGIWNITKRTLGGSTGDEEADAAIDAGSVVKNLVEADKLMAEAENEGMYFVAEKKMKEAIAKRPDDWTYRVTLANRGLMQGMKEKAVEQSEKGFEIVQKENNSKTTLKWINKNIEELEGWKDKAEVKTKKISPTHFTSGWDENTKYVAHKQLAIYYEYRAQLTGSAPDKQVAQDYDKVASQMVEDEPSLYKKDDWRLFHPQ